MSKKNSGILETAGKWLEKNAETGVALKPALAALELAELAVKEAAIVKDKMIESLEARKKAIQDLTVAIDKAKTEKKLKAKESRLQAKLASLSAKD